MDTITEEQAAKQITVEIKELVRTSRENRLPYDESYQIFDEPLVGFANGDDPIFSLFKAVITPEHLTPREALARAINRKPEDLPPLSVISWILPITEKTRVSNRSQTKIPTRVWAHTRWYGEFFNESLRRYLVSKLKEMGYLASAPTLESFWVRRKDNRTGEYSNWSERHIAFAAGLGTFSLSDGFITDRGIAHRTGSVITSLRLPATERKAQHPYANCLYYAGGKCRVCIDRCPGGAITEKGHDKIRCNDYQRQDIGYLLKEYEVGVQGCGLCQTGVPCEYHNPTRPSR
jgi:epoxyqueuosine reductase